MYDSNIFVVTAPITTPTRRVLLMPRNSNVLLHPSVHIQPGHTLIPSETSRPFDVTHQLETNLKAYTNGGCRFHSRRCPSYLEIYMSRLREEILLPPNNKNPSKGSLYSCCLAHGLRLIRENREVIGLGSLLRELYRSDGIDFSTVEQIHLFAKSFNTSFIRGGTERSTIRVPNYLYEDLSDRAADLGMSLTNTFVLCILLCLETQECLSDAHRGAIRKVLGDILGSLMVRTTLIRRMMKR